MKLVGFRKDSYDYVKEGNRIQGTNVVLYFSYKIPAGDGAGVAALSYDAGARLSRKIMQGVKPLVLGADYDIIPGEYGKIEDILPVDTGGKENKKE